MKTGCDKLANSAGYQEGDKVWLYRPIRKKVKSPNLQSSWEGPYKIVTWINDVVYRIQKNSRSRMMAVHLKEGAVVAKGEWSSHPGEKTNKRKLQARAASRSLLGSAAVKSPPQQLIRGHVMCLLFVDVRPLAIYLSRIPK
jgi:hypothetical protein